jgi:hypothetical protein
MMMKCVLTFTSGFNPASARASITVPKVPTFASVFYIG